MCGITGWLSLTESREVDSAVLERMRDVIQHRGPDGSGLWIAPSGRVGLGFRRLAIIDLSDSANQPMPNEDGSIQVVFNGEIYNHQYLRRELLSHNHRFRSDHSDTETIVHGYEQWGEKVVDHLEGMFAIGVWDEAGQNLFLARDRIGIKPLYITWTPSAFLFASEIKALLAHPEVQAEVEPLAIYHYLSFLTTPAPLTMFRGIYKIPAGFHCTVSADGSMQAERYWDALPGAGPEAEEMKTLSPAALRDFAVRRTRQLLDHSVRKRMMSDVPIGVFLSGGIDSSANAALMTKHLGRPVRTFTVGFSDHQDMNEFEYARHVAHLLNADHHEVMVDEKAMREYLPQLVISQDEPIADWVCIPLYFVSKLVRDSGTTVVQVGEGADEQFCGYLHYLKYMTMYRRFWKPYTGTVPAFARRLVSLLVERLMAWHHRHDTYLDLLVRAGFEREPFWSGATIFPESRKSRLLDKKRLRPLEAPQFLQDSGMLPAAFAATDTFEIVRSFFERLDAEAPGHDILTRMVYSEFKLRLPELLLMRVDKIGMSVSVEPRVPFLDHRLVEFTMNLPQQVKVADGVCKSVLKEAMRGLIPDAIIDRPKMGFGAPMDRWIRGNFGKAMEAELSASRFFEAFPANRRAVLDMLARHRNGNGDFTAYLWTVYNAVAWFDSWIEGSPKSLGA